MKLTLAEVRCFDYFPSISSNPAMLLGRLFIPEYPAVLRSYDEWRSFQLRLKNKGNYWEIGNSMYLYNVSGRVIPLTPNYSFPPTNLSQSNNFASGIQKFIEITGTEPGVWLFERKGVLRNGI